MPQVPRFGISHMPVSRELTPAGTSAHSRQLVKVDCFRIADHSGVFALESRDRDRVKSASIHCRRISLSRIQVKITGVTIKTCKSELTIPPKTGVASGFMNSAPVRIVHIRGNNPATTVATVITFGLKRKSAPSMTA